MDERYLLAAARYDVKGFTNVAGAGMRRSDPVQPDPGTDGSGPEDYCWSSTRAHLSGHNDDLVAVVPLLRLVGNWKAFISSGTGEEDMESIRRHERTGRPLGNDDFVARTERATNRILRKQKPGPKSEKWSSLSMVSPEFR